MNDTSPSPSASSSSSSSSPLQKIPFIQKILFFACRTVNDPIRKYSFVSQSWYESLRDDKYSTTFTIWSKNLKVFPGRTSEWVSRAYKDVKGKACPEFLDFSQHSDRFNSLRWDPSFTAAAHLMYKMIRSSRENNNKGNNILKTLIFKKENYK